MIFHSSRAVKFLLWDPGSFTPCDCLQERRFLHVCETQSSPWPPSSNPLPLHTLCWSLHIRYLSSSSFPTLSSLARMSRLFNPTRPNPFRLLLCSCWPDWSSDPYFVSLARRGTSAQQLFITAGPRLKTSLLPSQLRVILDLFGLMRIVLS